MQAVAECIFKLDVHRVVRCAAQPLGSVDFGSSSSFAYLMAISKKYRAWKKASRIIARCEWQTTARA
jgi:hypothetical protein